MKVDIIDCEPIWIEATNLLPNRRAVIGIVYRHPRPNISEFSSVLDKVLSKVCSENKTVFLIGDININLLKSPSNNAINNYHNMIKSNGMENFILSPTRISPHCTPSLIDHFYCNDTILNITK